MRSIYFDVDETLIFWPGEYEKDKLKSIMIDNISYGINQYIIDKLVQHSKSGDEIIVWSAGGKGWAKKVAIALEIDGRVDYFLTKPDFYYDDKHMKEWKGNRLYFNPFTGHLEVDK